MKAQTKLLALLASLALTGGLHAATMSVSAGIAPTVDGADIASLTGTTDIGGDQGHAWSNRPRQGQSFTTGTNALGYTLNAYTVAVRVDQASTTSPNWEVRIGTLDGSLNLTQLALENAAGVAIPNTSGVTNPAFVTFTLDSPLTLAPSTLYSIDLYPNGGGFISLNDNTNPFGGGTAISGNGANGGTGNPLTAHAGADRHFHVDIDAIPEPSSALLSLLGLAFLARRRR